MCGVEKEDGGVVVLKYPQKTVRNAGFAGKHCKIYIERSKSNSSVNQRAYMLYHEQRVCEISNNILTIDMCGFPTIATKDAINTFLFRANINLRIKRYKGNFQVTCNDSVLDRGDCIGEYIVGEKQGYTNVFTINVDEIPQPSFFSNSFKDVEVEVEVNTPVKTVKKRRARRDDDDDDEWLP